MRGTGRLLTAAILAVAGQQAGAASVDPAPLVAALAGQGYGAIAAREVGGKMLVTASRGGQRVEFTWDAATHRLIPGAVRQEASGEAAAPFAAPKREAAKAAPARIGFSEDGTPWGTDAASDAPVFSDGDGSAGSDIVIDDGSGAEGILPGEDLAGADAPVDDGGAVIGDGDGSAGSDIGVVDDGTMGILPGEDVGAVIDDGDGSAGGDIGIVVDGAGGDDPVVSIDDGVALDPGPVFEDGAGAPKTDDAA